MFKKLILATVIATATLSSHAWGFSNEFNRTEAIESMQKGGMVVIIRHAYAPGAGDPADVKWEDCSTQRNIKSEGKRQAAEMGKFLIAHNIVVGKALSSPMCRCYQTGELMGLDVEKNGLFVNKKNVDGIKDVIKDWNGKGNLFIFTHYTVINNTFHGYKAQSGSMLVIDNTGNKITRVGSVHFEYDLTNKE
jgi:phosphohistidine phosphatase SixA